MDCPSWALVLVIVVGTWIYAAMRVVPLYLNYMKVASTLEKVRDEFDANPNTTDFMIRKAIERYVVYPGQATAYMIGKLKILELRERAQEALGDKFTMGGFHDVILKSGPVPLDILEERVDAWIASGS